MAYNGLGWDTQVDLLKMCKQRIFPEMDKQRSQKKLRHKRILWMVDNHNSRDNLELLEEAVFNLFFFFLVIPFFLEELAH